ncbi:hypothetical protein A2943_02810 [Candidatus Adlerbacteria bacterium RIFCSPLOWO2_01_FULL_51_16]|uniref:Uncharacterized protein n=1 Tax=Candidatus Adlerbacteria bacterium RIFCSPLOWO2_01_FULL_51_16 TaxID=1797243 RepID=A0A1F4XGF0_9BACT|nr:MAG: hypothetical protein A2943_02810 [Candidatus Adlerbacteria bacterium RIFCSPLOWO2_01_FULL_51_16]
MRVSKRRNYRAPFFPYGTLGRTIRVPTEAELQVKKVNHTLRVIDAEDTERLSRKHVLEVQKHMPYIRKCKARGKPPRRVSKKILDMVERLHLV